MASSTVKFDEEIPASLAPNDNITYKNRHHSKENDNKEISVCNSATYIIQADKENIPVRNSCNSATYIIQADKENTPVRNSCNSATYTIQADKENTPVPHSSKEILLFASSKENIFKNNVLSPITNTKTESFVIHRNKNTNFLSSTKVINETLDTENDHNSISAIYVTPSTPLNSTVQFIERKLMSDSFNFSPDTGKYKNLLNDSSNIYESFTPTKFKSKTGLNNKNDFNLLNVSFSPKNHSTEMKEARENSHENGSNSIPKALFVQNEIKSQKMINSDLYFSFSPVEMERINENITKNVTELKSNIPVADNLLLQEKNISSETYNISKDSLSIESISFARTYDIPSPNVKDITRPKISSTEENCDFQATSNYQMPNFCENNTKLSLTAISEEDSVFLTPINKKAIVFQISPPKQPCIDLKLTIPRKQSNVITNFIEKTNNIKSLPKKKLALNSLKQSSDASKIKANASKTCHIDPFLVATLFSENRNEVDISFNSLSSENQTIELLKWLNALLSAPTELDVIAKTKKVDVTKLYQECIKENVSSKYLTNHKLVSLRKHAKQLYNTKEMQMILFDVSLIVEKNSIQIRSDKNLHLDVGLQSQIMKVILSYNPLWLRIGLETIYDEIISLESNSDVNGLSKFVIIHLFNNPEFHKGKKLSHVKFLTTYAVAIRKYTLNMFLKLIYFLDQAKIKKLIPHDPCLFCVDASVKDSTEILFSFTKELLSAGVGNVLKYLQRYQYDLKYKQNFVDEFNYAVKDLNVDLRDGIRLTRVVEIILERHDLTVQLRGPAISKLQKIHNVKVALDSLKKSDYHIVGDIIPKDIVEGHKEKTCSLLWQIILKFQEQNFKNAALKIQRWWRTLSIVIKRRILDKTYKQFLVRNQATITIQRFYRAWKPAKKIRENYLTKRNATIVIQRKYRATITMKKDFQYYQQLKKAVLFTQKKFRANQSMRIVRENYIKLRNAALFIQQKFKANTAMKNKRKNFFLLKKATLTLQRKFRSNIIMKSIREDYIKLKNTAIVIQRRFRANIAMKITREHYLELKKFTIIIQQRYRANICMKMFRKDYIKQKAAVITIQQMFRANIAMKNIRKYYLQKKKSAIIIQNRFRANKTMKQTRDSYFLLKKVTIFIQERFRANLAMKQEHNNYLLLKKFTIFIQQHYKANRIMKLLRKDYLKLKSATLVLQQRFRADQIMISVRENYLKLRNSVIIIQRKFRANVAMKKTRKNYLHLKEVTTKVQHRFRTKRSMRIVREDYLKQRNAAILIQRKFRAKIATKNARKYYLQFKNITVMLQQRFRANSEMKKLRKEYLQLKTTVTGLQRRYRANIEMKIIRQKYLMQKKIIILLQVRCRANIEKRLQREYYLKLKKSVVVIQQRFRANKLMKQEKKNYLHQRELIIFIQLKYKAKFDKKKCRKLYLQQKNSAIIIQRYFRHYLQRSNSAKLREYYFHSTKIIKLQSLVRMILAQKLVHQLREEKQKRRINKAATKIQALWRGYKTRSIEEPVLTTIRKRFKETNNQAVSEQAIGQRARESIDMLIYCESMKDILLALTTLDFATRLFPHVCIELCNQIVEKIYIFIVFSNRSVPVMEICELGVSILINLFKYEETSSNVWKEKYLERLLELLLNWSNTNGNLFPYLCTLFWLFTQNPNYCEVIKKLKNVDKILKKTFQQCQRKQKMMLTSKKSKNENIQSTSGKFSVPSLLPDWGIINKKKPHTFQNNIFALKCLLKKLTIKLN